MFNAKIKAMQQEKSFYDLYEEEKSKPTAAQVFIKNIATLTHRSELTVRMWLAGQQTPDELVQSIIAKEYGVSPATLFPKRKEVTV